MTNYTENINNLNDDKSDKGSNLSDKLKLESDDSKPNDETTPPNSAQNNSTSSTTKPDGGSVTNSATNQSSSNTPFPNFNIPHGSQTALSHPTPFNSQSSPTSHSSQNLQNKREQELEDEATRLFLDIASDPDLMNQALTAAVNPNVARELARQSDVAWRNIETIPGGHRALCQMHHSIQQPLWNAVLGHEVHEPSKKSSSIKTPVHNEPIKVDAMPNPWKTEPQHNQLYQQQPYQQQNFGGFPSSFSFGDMNPFSLFSQNTRSQRDSTSSPSGSSDMLSSVINRTSPSNFQTASQLIQNNSNKYSKEIDELVEMGITDREKCLIALEAADGDIFQALGILEELEKEESQDNTK